MSVTMKDVAQSAGVSVATVSRALAGLSVAEAKRLAVQRECERLGYRPDALAAALRTRSSGFVGILVPDITSPFFPAVVQTVEHELAAAAIDVVLGDANNDVAVEGRRLEMLLRRRVDALLVCPVDSRRSARALRSAASYVRLLQVDRWAIEEADFVGVDQLAGMSEIVEHLRSCGAESAVFAGLHEGMSSIVERAAAFETACQKLGVEAWPTVSLDVPSVLAGREFARKLISRRKLPAAVACANDEIAFGVLVELRAAGIACPAEVSVTGYDDIPAAELMGLTTVRQPLPELGREAARLLQHESNAARHVRLTPTLVVRSTTTGPSKEPGRG